MALMEHFERPIRDGSGVLIADCSVRLLEPGTTEAITDPVYADPEGTEVRTNPWVSENGQVDFYLRKPKVLRIGITKPGAAEETFFENVEVGSVDLARETMSFTIAGPVSVLESSLRYYIDGDGEIERVRVSLGVPPEGADCIVDVELNDVSIFGAGEKPTVLDGEHTGYLDLTNPVQVNDGDYLTVSIVQVGTTVTGSNLVAQARMLRY